MGSSILRSAAAVLAACLESFRGRDLQHGGVQMAGWGVRLDGETGRLGPAGGGSGPDG